MQSTLKIKQLHRGTDNKEAPSITEGTANELIFTPTFPQKTFSKNSAFPEPRPSTVVCGQTCPRALYGGRLHVRIVTDRGETSLNRRHLPSPTKSNKSHRAVNARGNYSNTGLWVRLENKCALCGKFWGLKRFKSRQSVMTDFKALSGPVCVGTLRFTAVCASPNSPRLTRNTSKWMTSERAAAGVTHHYHALHSRNYHPQPHVQVAALLINPTRNIPYRMEPPGGAATLPNF